jgi:hypothetical protein
MESQTIKWERRLCSGATTGIAAAGGAADVVTSIPAAAAGALRARRFTVPLAVNPPDWDERKGHANDNIGKLALK